MLLGSFGDFHGIGIGVDIDGPYHEAGAARALGGQQSRPGGGARQRGAQSGGVCGGQVASRRARRTQGQDAQEVRAAGRRRPATEDAGGQRRPRGREARVPLPLPHQGRAAGGALEESRTGRPSRPGAADEPRGSLQARRRTASG
eukprot:14510556-Alexandrium_andersonii.AAC.1